MRMVRPFLIACLFCAASLSPAAAHRLKLFATLENETISGYAFFVGAGRAQDAEIVIADQSGTEIARIQTDAKGAFAWKSSGVQTYRLTANTGDGHVATSLIDKNRFAPASEDEEDETNATRLSVAEIERAVDAAVARQLRPLIEAQEKAEARIRFNDVMGGIGMIIGLAGIALWASARRRKS